MDRRTRRAFREAATTAADGLGSHLQLRERRIQAIRDYAQRRHAEFEQHPLRIHQHGRRTGKDRLELSWEDLKTATNGRI